MSLFDLIDEFYEIEPQHRLMLQALVLKEPDSRKYFEYWLAEADLESMDMHTMRLVPALIEKYHGTLADSPFSDKILGIQRYFFIWNNLLFAEGRRVVEQLIANGIDVVLFKGSAVSLKYYKNPAYRPMSDIDVLIHPEHVPRAEEILFQCGFIFTHSNKDRGTDIHSHDYVNTRYNGFDLHWHALLESPHPDSDKGILRRAEYFSWGGVVVKLMSPEDLILTCAVNGVRDIDPIRPQWILDIVTIIKSEPTISWQTLWTEAKNRGLRETVLDAFKLVHGIFREAVPDAFSDVILTNDPEFCRKLLNSAINEGRTCHLNGRLFDEITATLSIDNKLQTEPDQDPIRGPGLPGYIRYFQKEDGVIDRLLLQWHHLPKITELFDVSDTLQLEKLIAGSHADMFGYLVVAPGLLKTKPCQALAEYKARLNIADAPGKLTLEPGEITEIEVEVENLSTLCWPVFSGTRALFGVTYHLLSENGTVETWDLARTYLSKEWRGYVSFIEPKQKLICKLKICAPREPGCYILQLDLVHERVTWFSHWNNYFPKIDLEVTVNGSGEEFYVMRPGILHNSIGDETIIINTHSGVYYSARGYASIIWKALVDGYSERRIVAAFISAGIFVPAQHYIQRFILQLLTERLIVPFIGANEGPQNEFNLSKIPEAQIPILVKRNDVRDLITRHPLKEMN